jgi:hypothetical protein
LETAVPAGGTLLLKGMLVVNASLADPQTNPSAALVPSGLFQWSGAASSTNGTNSTHRTDSSNSTSTGERTDGSTFGIGTTLVMRDVLLYVSTQTLQKYVQFMAAVPGATMATDGLSFLPIRNYSSNEQQQQQQQQHGS